MREHQTREWVEGEFMMEDLCPDCEHLIDEHDRFGGCPRCEGSTLCPTLETKVEDEERIP